MPDGAETIEVDSKDGPNASPSPPVRLNLDRPIPRANTGSAFLNLIANARQAMPRGGRLRVEVRENAQTQMAEIRVSDTGVGIPPEQLRIIFEPFFTTKEPDENGHGGTGLGLSVCRQIIEQHHGRIRVESVVGKGSKFTVKLPLEVVPV